MSSTIFLHQQRPREHLAHAQLAALHAARQIHLALAGKQRDGSHLAQVGPHRIVGVNRFFGNRKFFRLVPVDCSELQVLLAETQRIQSQLGRFRRFYFHIFAKSSHLVSDVFY